MSSLGDGVPLKLQISALKGSGSRADVAYSLYDRCASVLLLESVSVHVRLPVPPVSPWNLLTGGFPGRQTFPCRPPSFSTCMFHVSLCSVRSHRLCWSSLMHGSTVAWPCRRLCSPCCPARTDGRHWYMGRSLPANSFLFQSFCWPSLHLSGLKLISALNQLLCCTGDLACWLLSAYGFYFAFSASVTACDPLCLWE